MRYNLRTLLILAAVCPPALAVLWWLAENLSDVVRLVLAIDPIYAAVWLLWGLLVASPVVPLSVIVVRAASNRPLYQRELLELITALAAAVFVAALTWTKLDFYRE